MELSHELPKGSMWQFFVIAYDNFIVVAEEQYEKVLLCSLGEQQKCFAQNVMNITLFLRINSAKNYFFAAYDINLRFTI